jgi:hypothetical protein
MKKIFYSTLFLFSLIAGLSSCGTDDLEYKDVTVSAVNSLSKPLNGAAITLKNSSSSSESFEWSATTAPDSLPVFYEVVFDKSTGDFSKPIYRVVSSKLGLVNSIKIGHKVLDAVADSADIAPTKSGVVKWTIVSSRGINPVLAKEARTLTLTRF